MSYKWIAAKVSYVIVKCGHRYCRPCFEKLRECSLQMGVELKCPVDRDVVQLDQVRIFGCTYASTYASFP